ncbi:hypothetical protein CB0940_07611 [Cercospora beticola]|uniref:SprT-like domain-containing protein n=1 Tax=Cercospora beticola TaxID=122368 RepID=A0A2G5H8Q7_CERBT|nr:hypothetical protein CB0940_07611 [Cercospora beticola]PIA88918.1 hypothetical protein CB0940_07611 [Cercospora beticola]WPB03574.1 hypothetical protein RHO25_008214 [Cercospora beticola]
MPSLVVTKPYSEKRLYREKQRKLAELRISLRGCVCTDCEPKLPACANSLPVFSIFAGLSYRGHDAFHLATWAASSFATVTLQQTQQQALSRWHNLRRSYQHSFQCMPRRILQEAAEIFNELFFLGQLPASRLQLVQTGTINNGGSIGKSWPSYAPNQPELISFDASHHFLWSAQAMYFQVLLHEMIHCFLSRYTCYPWHVKHRNCAISNCGLSHHSGIGPGGHGRAWQFLAKAIEGRMPEVLQLPGNLGRNCGFLTDQRRHGYHMPCQSELQRLYQWEYGHPNFWKYVRRTRDDNIMEHRILMAGLVPLRHRGRRRASDSVYVLRSSRRPAETSL